MLTVVLVPLRLARYFHGALLISQSDGAKKKKKAVLNKDR